VSAGHPRRRGRSGGCYDDTLPTMHTLCTGTFSRRDSPNASPELRDCSCPCHTPEGAWMRAVPTARMP